MNVTSGDAIPAPAPAAAGPLDLAKRDWRANLDSATFPKKTRRWQLQQHHHRKELPTNLTNVAPCQQTRL
jgi:hypothetical protein